MVHIHKVIYPRFFFIFLILIFLAVRGKGRGVKTIKNDPKWKLTITSVTHLRNSIAYDHDFWYICVKWRYLQEFFFSFFSNFDFSSCLGGKSAKNSPKWKITYFPHAPLSQEQYYSGHWEYQPPLKNTHPLSCQAPSLNQQTVLFRQPSPSTYWFFKTPHNSRIFQWTPPKY